MTIPSLFAKGCASALLCGILLTAGCGQKKAELGSASTAKRADQAQKLKGLHIPEEVKQRILNSQPGH